MGKKTKKKQQKKAYVVGDINSLIEQNKKNRDDDGFMHLEWQPGKRAEVRQKMSAKVFDNADIAEAEREYDPKPLKKVIDVVEDLIKEGKYKKASKESDSELLNGFIEEYDKIEPTSINWEKMNAIAKRIITIGKSFYEYGDNIEFLSDKSYDGLLAKFLSVDGNVEPMGIIPKGSKNQKKVDITYPTLHNNMDKAYALKDHGPFPKGVKERDSAEAFLWRVYKAAGLEYSQEIELNLSPKIDGGSINGTIVGNSLRDPQTRGDSEESIAVLGLDNMVVTKHNGDETFGIQYELFVTEEDRVKASEYLKLDKPYVSCRHAATGIIHRLSTMEDDKLIDFISLYPINAEGLDGTYSERIDYIQNYGIVPKDMPKRKNIKGDLKELLSKINKYYENLQEIRNSLSFAIDGMVISVVDDDIQEKLGRNGRTNKWQIALKFDPSTITGKVKGIHLDIGKKGYRTVQVDLESPVYLDGVRYDHIPVPTAEYFEALDLAEGDKVEVHRVGDVIPALTVSKRNGGEKIKAPKNCPICGKKLIIHKKRYYCDNPDCQGNISGRFYNFFDKMGMDGYGEAFCQMLYEDLDCRSFADILDLTKESIEKAGVTSMQALAFPDDLKEAIKSHYDYEVIGAMGIPGVATEKARIFMEELNQFSVSAAPRTVTDNNLYSLVVKAVGPKQADRVYEHITSDAFIEDMRALNDVIVKRPKKGGRTIRVGHTGTILYEKTREICEQNGFEITDGSNFDILITNDLNSDSAKAKRARKKGLPMYLQFAFNERYEVNTVDAKNSISQYKLLKNWDILTDNVDTISYFLQILESIVRMGIAVLSDKPVKEVKHIADSDDKPSLTTGGAFKLAKLLNF